MTIGALPLLPSDSERPGLLVKLLPPPPPPTCCVDVVLPGVELV
jgi:hypothetical protein